MIYVPTIKITFCRSYIKDANTPNEMYVTEKTERTKLIGSYDGLQKYVDVKKLMEGLGHIVELVELERYYEHNDIFDFNDRSNK